MVDVWFRSNEELGGILREGRRSWLGVRTMSPRDSCLSLFFLLSGAISSERGKGGATKGGRSSDSVLVNARRVTHSSLTVVDPVPGDLFLDLGRGQGSHDDVVVAKVSA